MRISRRKPRPGQVPVKRHYINTQIRAPQVRLIDELGQNVGIVETTKAMAMAHERGLDLIQVSPLANPPVVRIVDYSKMRYEEEKERRKERAKQHKVEVKGIRLSLRISEHDREVRLKQAERFLGQRDKVKIEIILRGRERRHVDAAREIVSVFIRSLNDLVPVVTEQATQVQGGKVSALVARQ